MVLAVWLTEEVNRRPRRSREGGSRPLTVLCDDFFDEVYKKFKKILMMNTLRLRWQTSAELMVKWCKMSENTLIINEE